MARPITAFRCELCGTVHLEEAAADACCHCTDCGARFLARPSGGALGSIGSQCGHCLYGVRLRSARKSVREAEENLVRAKDWLARLVTERKPPKGTPP